MLMLFCFLALRLLGAAIFSLVYLMLAPAVALAPALGETGRAVFRKMGRTAARRGRIEAAVRLPARRRAGDPRDPREPGSARLVDAVAVDVGVLVGPFHAPPPDPATHKWRSRQRASGSGPARCFVESTKRSMPDRGCSERVRQRERASAGRAPELARETAHTPRGPPPEVGGEDTAACSRGRRATATADGVADKPIEPGPAGAQRPALGRGPLDDGRFSLTRANAHGLVNVGRAGPLAAPRSTTSEDARSRLEIRDELLGWPAPRASNGAETAEATRRATAIAETRGGDAARAVPRHPVEAAAGGEAGTEDRAELAGRAWLRRAGRDRRSTDGANTGDCDAARDERRETGSTTSLGATPAGRQPDSDVHGRVRAAAGRPAPRRPVGIRCP